MGKVLPGDERCIMKHPRRTLLLCYPFTDDMAAKALQLYRGDVSRGGEECVCRGTLVVWGGGGRCLSGGGGGGTRCGFGGEGGELRCGCYASPVCVHAYAHTVMPT